MRIFLSSTEAGAQKSALRSALTREEVQSKVFLSAVEASPDKQRAVSSVAKDTPLLWNLMSYYYIGKDERYAEMIRDKSELILIDSGAHSFQKGKKVDWVEYTKRYADFINRFDRPNVLGYFEMDVDNLLGYEEVLELRRVLHNETGKEEKIIPVWHKNRGLDEYKRMCEQRAGKIVAITGFKNEDIRDEQYLMFLKEAKRHGCKVHCLGMTRKAILDRVPFDYVDSSSWAQSALYGRVGKRKVSREFSKTKRDEVFLAAYQEAMKMQRHYYEYWKGV